MLRTQVSLTQEQHRRLTTLASETGRSMSDLIRNAIDSTYGHQRTAEQDVSSLRATFGAWQAAEETGAAYVERIRTGRRLRAE